MSQVSPYQIVCPKCRHDQEVELYDAINIDVSPELKDLLMTNQLNSVVCEQCEFAFRVDKPLLYNDPLNQVMIYLIPELAGPNGQGQDRFQQVLCEVNKLLPEDAPTPDIHLVTMRTELVERIFLLEQGLDARIVEYIKHTIYTKNPARLKPTEKNVLFNAQDSNEEKLVFVIQDIETQQLEGLLEYSREAYNGLSEMFDHDEKTANLLELFPGPYYSARSTLLQDAMNT